MAGALLAGTSLLLMMALGALDVLTTNLLLRPIPATREATEALMVVAVFLAMAYAQGERAHIAVDLVSSRLPTRLQHAIRALGDALTLVVFALVASQGWRYGLASLREGEFAEGLISFPIYPAKLALALGASLMALQTAWDLAWSAAAAGRGRGR